MELIEDISSMNHKELIPFWLNLCQNCYETQERTLFDILNHSKDSEIGQKFDFENIGSIEEYQEKVPILEYDDISDYIERMADGEEDILFPGRTSFFISTSGTTGNSKKIPENEKSKKAKSIVSNLRNMYFIGNVFNQIKSSELLLNHFKEKGADLSNPNSIDSFYFYSVTSASPNKKTKGGIEVGFASGKTFDNSSSAQKTLSYPAEIMGLSDGEATMYLSMLFALRYEDIFILAANNAGRVYSRVKYAQEHAEEIIDDLKNGTITNRINITDDERELLEGYLEPHVERAEFLEGLLSKGREYFIPKYYWPYIIAARFWLGGSVGVNVDKLKPYLPDTVFYFDVGYGASEGKINVPFKPATPEGTLGIASVFYEFVSMDTGEILTADQLELDREYDVILTTYSGLYRYPLHDVVKVTGFTGNTPNIEFVTKSKEILNVAQEKVPAPVVVDLLTSYFKENQLTIVQSQIFPDLENANYQIYMELEEDVDTFNYSDFENDFDDILIDNFELYGRNRKFDSLNKLKFHLMVNGWQDELYREKEKTGAPKSQIKLPSIIDKKPNEKWIKVIK